MTKAALISITGDGNKTAMKIRKGLCERGFDVDIFSYVSDKESGIEKINEGYIKWLGNIFYSYGLIIFVCACGIAVRGIAPYIKDKFTDPAVIVVDEKGRFAVPILSGHVGGANSFALEISNLMGAQAVITTSTDINNKFAVDLFAKKNGLIIGGREEAKRISSNLISGGQVCFLCDKEIKGHIPDEIILSDKGNMGFVVSVYKKRPYEVTLNLIPKKISLGIGCRRNTTAEEIEKAVFEALNRGGIFKEAVNNVGTIDIKKDEKGLSDFCASIGVDIKYFSSRELKDAEGDFSHSDFVSRITGVDNVCERAAALLCPKGEKIISKTVFKNVAVAAYCDDWSVDFG